MNPFHYEGEQGEPVPPGVEKVIVHALVIHQDAFYLCGSLVQVSLQEGLRTIGVNAFCGCHSLTSIEIPSSVETIESLAFAECTGLQQVHLLNKEGSSLTKIGLQAFASCSSLERISILANVERIDDGAFSSCGSLVEAVLQQGLKYLGSDVFAGCSALRRIEIPSSVESMGENLLSECTSLMEIHLHNKLLEIGRGCFFGCSSLPTITLPETTENLAFGALWNCTALTLVQLNEGLLQIDDYAFRACSSLQTIAIPQSVKMIGIRAFRSCTNLVTVEFASHMSISVMDQAFAECTRLVNVVIPFPHEDLGITAVAEDCFEECIFLEDHFDRDNMAGSLVHRFDGFPIHKLCYYSSSTMVADLEQLCSELDESDLMLDRLGMSPFHILLSAAKSRTDLLQFLLDLYPSHLIGQQDVCGRRATDYISSNWTEDSKSLLRMALEGWMLEWLADTFEGWEEDIWSRIDDIIDEGDVQRRGQLLEATYDCFLEYQRIEVTSLLEIALWKQMLPSDENTDSREMLRVRCGAPIVIPNVLAYF